MEQQLKTQKKLYGLDHLRAFAICSVFLFHYFIISKNQPDWLPEFARFGWTGVDLFFVLSGFLISSQLFLQIKKGQQISFKNFFLKRFFRIIPLYWFIIIIYFSIPFFREKEALPTLWKFLFFTQNFDLYIKKFGTFSHAWSLCVEEHFYLLLPIILIVLQTLKSLKKSYWILIIFFVFGFFIRNYRFNYFYLPTIDEDYSWANWYKFIYYPTYNRLDGLLVGVTIAAVYHFSTKTWASIAKYGNLFILLSLIVLTCAYFLCYDIESYYSSVFGFPLIAIGYGLMVVAAISPTSFLYKWNSKVTKFIAAISYALYLSHKGVIHITLEVLKPFNLNSNYILIIATIACFLTAFTLNIIIEKPFMNLRNKIIK